MNDAERWAFSDRLNQIADEFPEMDIYEYYAWLRDRFGVSLPQRPDQTPDIADLVEDATAKRPDV